MLPFPFYMVMNWQCLLGMDCVSLGDMFENSSADLLQGLPVALWIMTPFSEPS